ncbi:MAG: hypothetical protein V5A43_01530 [Haloarculaceae archaeon]
MPGDAGRSGRSSRRRALRIGGALLVGGLAGCKLLPDGSGDPPTTTLTPAPVPDAGGGDASSPSSSTVTGASTTTRAPPAADVTVTTLLRPPDGEAGANFGAAVALEGDRALVGAPRDRVAGQVTGAAYVFRRVGTTWRYATTLRADSPAAWEAVGRTVALDDRWSLVGAPGETHAQGERAGAVHVYRHTESGWRRAAKLYPEDGQGERFGTALAIDDGVAIVGSSPLHRIDAPLSGSAYVFEWTGEAWDQTATLTPTGGDARDVFGDAVSLRGGRAVVSAPRSRRERDGARPGVVYVYDRGPAGWSQTSVLAIPGGSDGDAFGESVALAPDLAVVGAGNYRHQDGKRDGAVAVFDRTGTDWSLGALLRSPDGEATDRFAHAVAVDDGRVVGGAPGDSNPNGEAAGAAYVFVRDGFDWTVRGKVRLNRGEADDRFGRTVALEGRTGLIGAVGDADVDGTRVGSAAVLRL